MRSGPLDDDYSALVWLPSLLAASVLMIRVSQRLIGASLFVSTLPFWFLNILPSRHVADGNHIRLRLLQGCPLRRCYLADWSVCEDVVGVRVGH